MRQSLSSATAEDTARIARFEAAEEQASGRSSWPVLLLRTSTELVELGVNPAGPKASMARLVADQNLPWYRVHRPPTEGLWHTLPTELTVHDLDRQRESLATELASSIFDRAGRDVESIGLGWVDASIELAGWPIPPTLASEVVRSIIRILGTSRRYAGGNSSTGMPDAVKKYLRAVAELQGVDPADLSDAVEGALDQPGVAPEWMLSSASADSKLEARRGDQRRPMDLLTLRASTPSPLGRDLHGNWLQSCAPRDPNGGPRGPGLLRVACLFAASPAPGA